MEFEWADTKNRRAELEQGRRQPEGLARALRRVIEHEPQAVQGALPE